MIRSLLLSLVLCLFSSIVYGQQIDEETAKIVGTTFLTNTSSSTSGRNSINLELIYKAGSHAENPKARTDNNIHFYVFNTTQHNGFVIVSGNENVSPILGYSNESAFDPANIPPQMAKWLEGYKNEIRYVVNNKIEATKEIETSWKELKSGEMKSSAGRVAAVSPLIQTNWNQSPFYNDLCPYDNLAGDRTITGCVATAMAQVMKFWNYPQRGIGSHSYNHPSYGTLAANFGATTYQWSAMPNVVNSSNSAVATLMYHCGVSVDMDYGTSASGGSSAVGATLVGPALKNYFGYSTSVSVVNRGSDTNAWISLLKNELDGGRPMYYEGAGNGSGHAFVCDGYDANNFFHFNWGWNGLANAYYNINALNPTALGYGAGLGSYNSNQKVVIGIKPPAGSITSTYDMRLFSPITTNPPQVIYKAGFSVTVDLFNAGTTTSNNFTGDYTAALFNSNNQFVAYVETKTGYSLPFGYRTTPLVFTYPANVAQDPVTPGDYTIGIYYKPTGSTQWVAFTNGNYQNFISLKIQGNSSNALKLNSAITTTTNPVIQNKPLSVKLDIKNSGSSAFNGVVTVDLHDSDGKWIRELSRQDISLAINANFPSGLTYSIPAGLTEDPGTYQLFVWSQIPGGDWTVMGSGSFSNPINIILVAPPLVSDIYESNNIISQAYALPISFSGDNTNKNTVGSNCHIGSDYDYYKIILPAGADYTISPRLQDSQSSSDGNKYTLDALFSYSTDGGNWSEAYDDVAGSDVKVTNGGTIYFHVAPYFSGETGTYLLDINVTRKIVIVQQSQSISFPLITTKTMGDAAFTLNATATSSLSPVYTSTSDKISINGNSVALLKPGRTTITASQPGDASFLAATPIDRNFCINPARPKITITNPFNVSVTLASSAPEGNQWYMNGIAISGATGTTLTATKVGIYNVQAKTDDCFSELSVDTPLVITGDLNTPSQSIIVYPNPVEDYLEIQGLNDTVTEWYVLDMIGRSTAVPLEKNGISNYRLNVKQMTEGVYMLRIKEGELIHHLKFIKK